MIDQDTTREQTAVTDSLVKARETVADLPTDVDFQQYIVDRDISIDSSDPLLYWEAVRDFTETQVQQQTGGSQLEKESTRVIAGLPASLTQAYYLESQGQSMRYAERRSLKEGVSDYNKLLKDFIAAHPQGSDELKATLIDAVFATMGADSRDFTTHAENSIDARLRGMKHEIAFAKVLESLGVSWREATVEEDLKGRDLIIDFNGREIGVDVKASLSEVTAHNGDATRSPVVYDEKHDRFIIFSGFVEKDFRGSFDVSSSTVEERAPMIGALLQAAILQHV